MTTEEKNLTLELVLEEVDRYIDVDAVAAYWENEAGYNSERPADDVAEFIEEFEEAYCGRYGNEADFAEEYLTEVDSIPDRFVTYIDWDRVWRDFSYDGFFSVATGGGYYIFRSI